MESYSAGIYLFKLKKKQKTICEICSKLAIKKTER